MAKYDLGKVAGIMPEINDDGFWVIDGEDSGKPSRGATPTIGENGNWFIDGKDTGIRAQGLNGKDGKDGTDGTDGTNGTNGTNGRDGIVNVSVSGTTAYITTNR